MILGLHHPGVAVPDMQAALAFYCGVLGFTVVMEAELPAGWSARATPASSSSNTGSARRVIRCVR
jgi:catechol 2,3-dioxygenase-like lactoylglutathione lyase family enzyme